MRLFSLATDRRLLAVGAAAGGWWDLTPLAVRLGISAEDGWLGPLRAPASARAALLDAARAASVVPLGGAAPALDIRPLADGAARVCAPLERPGKIMCIGRNYREHCEEQDVAPPPHPTLFSKWPSCIVGDGEAIIHPAVTSQLDYEGELAAVIGARVRHATPDDALGAIFAYTIADDVTARDLQKSDGQWARAKGCDTFCPLGPCLVTADEIPDPQGLTVTTRVNGEQRQHAATSQMMFPLRALIVFLSQAFTLEPGDLLLTGTPAGVGAHRKPPSFLRGGDVVAITIPPIGTLTNRVARPEP